MHWITEEHYASEMHDTVEPFVAARKTSGCDERMPGHAIYYEHFAAGKPKGVVVISHGFTESVQKFTESIYYMLQQGYEVWGFDHHGHGKSYRLNDNPHVVHADRFEDYVLDLKHLVEAHVIPAANGLPLYLYCHSMGGCVGAWTIEEYPALFQKAVLSSPMLGLSFGSIPAPVMAAAAGVLGIGKRKQKSLQPAESFNPTPDFANSADSSECRYLYYLQKQTDHPELQTYMPSIGWGRQSILACRRVSAPKNMQKIRIPILLLQAGEDTMVKNAAQDAFAAAVPSCTFERIPGVKHELYMTDSDVLIPYWERVFAFLEA